MKHMPHVRLWLGLAMALGTASLNATVDPATVWNWEDLSRTPKTWVWQGPFNGEVRPIWIEGVPFRGRQTRCFAFFGIPAQASPSNSVPGIVLVHGGMGTAYSEWVRQWVQRGYAAVAVDTCGAMPVRGEGVHDWLRSPYGGPSSGTKLTAIDEPLSDQWVYHAVAAVVRSHSFLRAQPGVAADRIGITGISWGGVLTCIVAALDSRLAYAVPVYGCGFNAEAEKGFATASGVKVSPAFSFSVAPVAGDKSITSPVKFAGAKSDYDFTFADDVKVRSSLGVDLEKGNTLHRAGRQHAHCHAGCLARQLRQINSNCKHTLREERNVIHDTVHIILQRN